MLWRSGKEYVAKTAKGRRGEREERRQEIELRDPITSWQAKCTGSNCIPRLYSMNVSLSEEERTDRGEAR